MSRARLAALAALALGAAACTDQAAPAVTVAFRQPSSLAVFRGYTLDDPVLRPYLAIANASRNDLSIVDAQDDTPVLAPIALRTLAIAVDERPALLASASLGDGLADLLVAVSAGSSEIQLVRTWSQDNDVESVLDLGVPGDVVALAVVPSPAGTARIAAALSDRRLAVVEYARSGEAIVVAGAPVVHPLPFQAVALAAMPGDEGHVYAASREPVDGGAVLGVGEVDVAAGTVRALDARGPTRLVAAARVRERRDVTTDLGAGAFDLTAQPVPRVYAVLDEAGCGPGRRIDCGIVALDPSKSPLAGDDHIPEDWAGQMPYRAPMRVPGEARALAVSGPPAAAPSGAGNEIYAGDLMRLRRVDTANPATLATTAVGAVAGDDGNVTFLDLGRFAVATSVAPVRSTTSPFADLSGTDEPEAARLWIQREDGSFPATVADAEALVEVTPGFTVSDTWSVTYQGILPGLAARAGEADLFAPGQPWLALQIGEGAAGTARLLNQVVRLHHPSLGVRAEDIAVIPARSVAGCTGTVPPGTAEEDRDTADREFEARIEALLAPTPAYPGGAVLLARPDPLAGDPAEWVTCFDALLAAVGGDADAAMATGLEVTLRAGGLVLTGAAAGYAGRPALGADHVLEYFAGTDEDALAAACAVDGWGGSLPAPACDATCRTECERLVLARKARRFHHLAEGCPPADDDCEARWAGVTFPLANDLRKALGFRVAVQPTAAAPTETTPQRDMRLTITTSSGVSALLVRSSVGSPYRASGAVSFDRSSIPGQEDAGYRFFFSYPGNLVLDVTPSIFPLPAVSIR